jgi:hypothetical protein
MGTHRILRNNGQRAPEVLQADLGNIHAVDQNRPSGQLHEPVQSRHKRRLPGSRPPNNPNLLSRGHVHT